MLKQLTCYGHSCYRIEAENGWMGIFDPYQEGSVPGLSLPHPEADTVLCSHEHADHNGIGEVELRVPAAENPYRTVTFLTDHDDKGGSLRGKSLIHVLTCGEEKIVHLGDLGCIPSEMVLASLKHADLLMIPCGGFYTIDAETAKELIEMLEPGLAVLMHYRKGDRGYDVLASEEEIRHVIREAQITGQYSIMPQEYTGIVFLEPHPDAVPEG